MTENTKEHREKKETQTSPAENEKQCYNPECQLSVKDVIKFISKISTLNSFSLNCHLMESTLFFLSLLADKTDFHSDLSSKEDQTETINLLVFPHKQTLFSQKNNHIINTADKHFFFPIWIKLTDS